MLPSSVQPHAVPVHAVHAVQTPPRPRRYASAPIVILGPRVPQRLELSPSSADSTPSPSPSPPPRSARTRARLRAAANVSPSPARRAQPLVPSPTDWVDYSRPLPGLDVWETGSDASGASGPAVILNPAPSPPLPVTADLLGLLGLAPPAASSSPPTSPLSPGSPATPVTPASPAGDLPEMRAAHAQLCAEAALLAAASIACDACGAEAGETCARLLPCGDMLCFACFGACLSAVSMAHGASKCAACTGRVESFDTLLARKVVPVRPAGKRTRAVEVIESAEPAADAAAPCTGTDVFGPVRVPRAPTVVLRIDNVAWDVDPATVAAFLPPDSLPPGHPNPIHICLDRYDGRTKDYLYVEVASAEAARRVLRTCQNAFMPGPRRARAVTVSQVSPAELTAELRPSSRAELDALLDLCDAALCTAPAPPGPRRQSAAVSATGRAHYCKHRHAPFRAVLSVLSRLRGPDSPAYWDVFRLASGAIAALAGPPPPGAPVSDPATRRADARVLGQLRELFAACFARGA